MEAALEALKPAQTSGWLRRARCADKQHKLLSSLWLQDLVNNRTDEEMGGWKLQISNPSNTVSISTNKVLSPVVVSTQKNPKYDYYEPNT